MASPRPEPPQRGLSSLAARAAAAAAAVGDESAVRSPPQSSTSARPAHQRRQSSADFGAFVGSSSDLDWGPEPSSSSSALPSSAAAPTSQPDWSAWDSLASSSTATPLPYAGAGNSGSVGFNAADDAFFAAFEQATLASSASPAAAGAGRESPPIIDLRPTERKLAAQAAARSPKPGAGAAAGRTASQSRQAEDDFFAAFERAPEETLRRLPKPPALMGDDLDSMTDARLSPMAIPASAHSHREYFSTAPPSAQEREKQSQHDDEQGWTGSLRRTWGSLRGLPAGLAEHLPSVADFVVPPGEGSSSSEEDYVHRDRGRAEQGAWRDDVGAVERRPSSSSTSSSTSVPKRGGLAHAADYSSSTPFGTSSGAAPAPRRGSTLGSASGATLSGAPGFSAAAPQRWNTGSWSLPAASPSAARQPIPVTLAGRAEESEVCITQWHASRLQAQLPPRSQLGKTWRLLYNLDQHGISLQTLYANVASGLSSSGAARGGADSEDVKEGWLRGASREARAAMGETRRVGGGLELKDAGIVVAVIDSRENVFGVYLNERLRAQSSYYGSGECFLWKTTRGPSSTSDDDTIKVFRWTGRNDYVALTEQSYLSFGGGDGRYGLWLDGRLENGVSARCPAFDNDVLCDDGAAQGEKEGRFEVLCVEVWAVGID